MAINLNILSKFDDKGLKNAQRALQDFGKQAATAAGVAVAAVGAIGYQSVKAFASFDAQMTKSLAIMGDVSEGLQKEMSDAAREVAKSTTFSADQAAESYFFLASAGLDAKASIMAMPKVAAFAQAGMFDMALATDLLTDAQSALGLTIRDDAVKNMENMVRVSDVLVKANTLANASVEQFSTALTTKAGAALRALGKDVEEGVAVLAAFADQGIKGEIAGTQLSIVLRDLTTKAIDNKSAFKKFGVEVFDANGEMNNMADIIGDLEGALEGMSDETAKATLLQMGFSDKSLASLMALMGTSEAIRQYEEDLRIAGGTTEDVANKQLETLMAQLDLLKSKFVDIGIGIGASLAPTVTEFIENIDPVLSQLEPALVQLFEALAPVLAEVIGELPTLIENLIPLIPIAGDLALVFLHLVTAILPVFEGLMETLGPAVDGFTGFLAEHGEVVGALIVTFGLFRAAVLLTTGALGLFTGANITAAGSSAGFWAILARNPLLAVAGLLIGTGVAIVQLGSDANEQGALIQGFYKTLANTAFGVSYATHAVANSILASIAGMANGFVKATLGALNAVRKAMDMKAVAVPEIAFTPLEMPRLDDYLKEFGFGPDMTPLGVKIPLSVQMGQRPLSLAERVAQGDMLFGGATQYNLPRTSTLLADMQTLNQAAQRFGTGSMGGQYVQDFYVGQALASPVNYNVYVNAGLGVNGNRLGEEITTIIERYQREAGPVFAAAR